MIVAAMLGAVAALTAAAQGANDLAQAVKAVYLVKFAPFVEWPPSSAAAASFEICVVGPDPFGTVLDRAAAGAVVRGVPVVIRRVPTVESGGGCRIMFLSGPKVRQELAALRGRPVLTVTDGFASPGVIDFVIDHDRVRFRIDEDTAASGGLTISSKLLALAASVTPRRGGAKP